MKGIRDGHRPFLGWGVPSELGQGSPIPVAVPKRQHRSGKGFGRGVRGPGGRISQGIASWIAGLGMGKGVAEGCTPGLFNFMRLRKKKSPCTFMPSVSSCNQGQKYHRAGSSHSLCLTLAHPPQDSLTNIRKPKKI